MKSSPLHGIILSTTINDKNIWESPVKENRQFVQIANLAADHNVTAPGTMIKVTYKKALKDNFELSACSNGHNFTKNSVLINRNMSSPSNKPVILNKKTSEAVINKNIVDMSRNIKSPNKVNKGFISPVLHSTPKLDGDLTEKKKREYINGLNLVVKLHDIKYKTSNSKNRSGSSFNVSTPSAILNSSDVKNQGNLNSKVAQKKSNEGDKSLPHSLRFLKDVTVVKIKGSINSKNFKEQNSPDSLKLKTKSKKEENQLNNNVKKEVDGLKRKIKINEVVVTNKKAKMSPLKSSPSCTPKIIKNTKDKEPDQTILFSEKIKNVNKSEVQVENNSNGSCKKELLMVDPDLPSGWKRMIRTRFKGTHNEKHIVYIYSPQGKKFQFKWKLRRYLERINSSLNADQFHFGLYKRTRPFVVPPLPEGAAQEDLLNKSVASPNIQSHSSSNLKKNTLMSKTKSKDIKNSSSPGNSSLIKNRRKAQTPDFEIYKTSEKVFDADGKQLLLYDPDLPLGWKRIINANNSNGKLRVYIISPEGIIFRRRHRLQEYLTKNEYTHSLDRFYFGLHPKKDPLDTDIKCEAEDCDNDGDDDSSSEKDEGKELNLSKTDMWKFVQYNTPMYFDPHLPEGWRRFIKIRQCGESAGRMEVILVSPDGKRHRSKLQLEQYILQNNLNLRADDFDFSVFGKERKQCPMIPMELTKDSSSTLKRKSKPPVSSDRPVPDLDISTLKDIKLTPESELINTAAGLMITSDLSSARGERRLRMPRKEHEKLLKMHLELENENTPNDCDILINWIQRLVKCRSDFRALELDAASLIAEKTKEFIKEMSSKAFLNSEDNEGRLRYEDIAHIVSVNECLSPLKILIPKKITYKEYLKLNRPTQFMSFT